MTGEYELHLGDCLDIMPTLEAGSVDAIITDPPYGTKKVAWDESIDPLVFSECLRISRGPCAFFYSNTRLWHILGELHKLGVDTWVAVWHKTNAMGFERKFAPLWVPIVIAYRRDTAFFGQDVMRYPITPQKNGHPTPKPVAVTQWLVEKLTKPGNVVLDPFMGSGTTGLAALNTGRRFVGIERDENYYNIGVARMAAASAARQPALLEAS